MSTPSEQLERLFADRNQDQIEELFILLSFKLLKDENRQLITKRMMDAASLFDAAYGEQFYGWDLPWLEECISDQRQRNCRWLSVTPDKSIL